MGKYKSDQNTGVEPITPEVKVETPSEQPPVVEDGIADGVQTLEGEDTPAVVDTNVETSGNEGDEQEPLPEQETTPEENANLNEDSADSNEEEEAPLEDEHENEAEPIDENYGVSEIKAIISNKDMSLEDKLTLISEKGNPHFKMLAIKLLSYAKELSRKNNELTPIVGAGKNFDLHNTLLTVADLKDYAMFKTSMDVVLLAFRAFKTDAFHMVSLHRFDGQWSWSMDDYNTFISLITVLGTLCEPSTRQTAIKTLDLSKAFNSKKTRFSAQAVENITRYFKQ